MFKKQTNNIQNIPEPPQLQKECEPEKKFF